jgi:hypothetical protein
VPDTSVVVGAQVLPLGRRVGERVEAHAMTVMQVALLLVVPATVALALAVVIAAVIGWLKVAMNRWE